MKECKKCGAIMPGASDDNVCEECKQKKRKIIKVATSIAVFAATVVMFTKSKDIIGKIPAKQILDVTHDVISGFVDKSEKLFGGLSQSTLDGLAKSTNGGVKAIVKGDSLEYFYKSASGKSIYSTIFNFDDKGKLIAHLGNGTNFYANSPRFFYETILEKIQKIT